MAKGDTANTAANSTTGQDSTGSGGGADPGMGSAAATGPELSTGQTRVQLSGPWTNRETGEDHPAGEWVSVDTQTARDLDTAGYVMRGGDGQPLTYEAYTARETARETQNAGDADTADKATTGQQSDSSKADSKADTGK